MNKKDFFKSKLKNKLSLILLVIVLGLIALGCSGPAWQGWSGFASYDGILYFGSMDGRVFAIDPSARNQGLHFPSEGEWVIPVRAPAATGGMCGPIGCAPAAQLATVYGTPVVAGDLVYVATYAGDSGKVMAINRLAPGYDEEGIPAWNKGEWFYPRSESSFIGSVVSSPVMGDDTLYVCTSDGNVYALDAVIGEKKGEEFDTGGKIWTSPALEDGVIYVSNYEKKLFALSGQDLIPVWAKPTELPAAVASSLVVAGNDIFFGTFDNQLYAVDGANGNVKWTFSGGNWFWATPLVKDNIVYAGCLDNKVYALDASTGDELWQFTADNQIVATPALADNLLVVASESGTVYILNADSGNLEHDPVPVDASVKVPVRAPLYAEGNMVYVHASNRCVYAVDVQSGDVVWKFPYSDIK